MCKGVSVGEFLAKFVVILSTFSRLLLLLSAEDVAYPCIPGRSTQVSLSPAGTPGGANNVGVIQSPNYPLDYPGSTSCLWKIAIPPGHMFNLKFNPTCFSLESTPRGCLDWVQIKSDTVNLTQCGAKRPPDLHFNFEDDARHDVEVSFKSSKTGHACGFSAKFSFLDWRNSLWNVTRCDKECFHGGICVKGRYRAGFENLGVCRLTVRKRVQKTRGVTRK